MIVTKTCCFTCQSIPALAANCQGSLKLVYDSSRQMSKCHYALVLIRSRWMAKKVGDSARSIQIQCADDVVIHGHIGRNLADVQLRRKLLEPHLWLGYPDREKVQIAPDLVSGSGRLICHMAIIIVHRKSIC
ncbi:hypothetical protein T05_443 [Trichinella murrelli]|uniref:Uncharacterized protein n=1 Tax=Trichinella murrelli TaxID=144512 RepID=A0A0V0T475_9BILA|nr:hypothetical protein T05_443 [Trichinella murrelli]